MHNTFLFCDSLWFQTLLTFDSIFQITESTCEFRTPANADPHDQCGGDEKAGLKCRKVSQYCNEEFEWHCNRHFPKNDQLSELFDYLNQ